MVGISNPPEWEHEVGYHLNADGKSIVYRHPERGLEIFIEAMVDEGEDYDELSYWGLLNRDGTELEGPVHFTPGGHTQPKEAAIGWLEETMDEYA